MVSLFALILAALPTIETPVVDPDDHLTAPQEADITARLVRLREATGVQMAVVILDTTRGQPIEDAAQHMFDRWGGGSTERDDGVLFVLAIKDRRSRLHLGYGVEPFIPDSVARRILDDQRRHLRAEDYARASHAVVARVADRVAQLKPGEPIEIPLGTDFPQALFLVFALGLVGGLAWGWRGLDPATALAVDELDAAIDRQTSGRTNHWIMPAAIWLLAPVVIGLVFRVGKGFWFAYPLVWFAGAAWGVALLYVFRHVDRTIAVLWGFVGVIAVPVAIFTQVPPIVSNGNEVMNALMAASLALGLAGVVAAFLRGMAAAASADGGGYSSGGSWSSSSSSSSSSSWSSSSSSSWSSSSSSSSSSTSWSGGGGSSGGGGASSSW